LKEVTAKWVVKRPSKLVSIVEPLSISLFKQL
jgi:hypothetical protein